MSSYSVKEKLRYQYTPNYTFQNLSLASALILVIRDLFDEYILKVKILIICENYLNELCKIPSCLQSNLPWLEL